MLAQQVVVGSVPPVCATLQPIGTLQATQRLTLCLGLPFQNQGSLEAFLNQVYDPASPGYRRFLRPAEFRANFSPSDQDYQRLIAFAQTNGLKVTSTSLSRTLLLVNGTVADIQRIFNVRMLLYNHPIENRTFFAPNVEPSVASPVPLLTISGLNNYEEPEPASLRTARADNELGPVPLLGSGPSGSYLGTDFRTAYAPGVPLTGAGQVVGLMDLHGEFWQSDITAYEYQGNLDSVPVHMVLVGGWDGVSSDYSADFEIAMDIEMAISIAPGVSAIIAYAGAYTSSANAVLEAMANPPQGTPFAYQLSSSWNYPRDASSLQSYQQFAAQGQSFFHSSGDHHAYTTSHYGAFAFTPPDETNVTIVGGTVLTTGAGGAWQSEAVWNDASEGATGGVSRNYSIPTWQQGISMVNNKGSTTMRNFPDVAMVANNIYVTFYNGQSQPGGGGTSSAAPLWAGFTALVNQQAMANGPGPLGCLNPALYGIGEGASYASCFHDITIGNNYWPGTTDGFPAVAGYDLCTGWGSPNGASLINAMAGTALLTDASATATTFSFNIGVGPGVAWALYWSADLSLSSWSLVTTGTGPSTFTDRTVSGVAARFYRLGVSCGMVVGFTRVQAPAGFTLIANQLDAPVNTLNGVFAWTQVPDGALLYRWNVLTGDWDATVNEWSSGSWLPNGGTTFLWPGQGALFYNPSSSAVAITFVGLIRDGQSGIPFTSGQEVLVSSVIPRSGLFQSGLGYSPNVGDTVSRWINGGLVTYSFDATRTWVPSQPTLNIGEAALIQPAADNVWLQSFSLDCY